LTAILPPMGARRARRTHLVHSLCALLGACALLAFAATAAPAATLQVTGPAGTSVYVNGELVGVLPLPAPVEVEPGSLELLCRKPGHLVHREELTIDGPESEVSIRMALEELSRTRAVGSSVVLAGLGQLYQGRSRIGWTMVAVQGSAWLVAAAAEASFQSSRDDFEVLQGRYEDAVLETEIVRLRTERDAAYDDLQSARDLRRVAIGAVIAVGLWSVFDAWRAHDGFFAEIDVPSYARVPSGSAVAVSDPMLVRFGWKGNF
jgi:hypothetical protein